MLKEQKIGFIGAGSMAESILAGLVEKDQVQTQNISLINRTNVDRIKYLTQLFRLNPSNHIAEKLIKGDIIIIAVKPKDLTVVLKDWGHRFRRGQTVISVVAGISTAYIESYLNQEVAVIRVMPNTSCTVGLSATAICCGKWVKQENLDIAHKIFKAIGSVIVVKEGMMDAVTGLSGSGPAYFYYMVEALELAGIQAGLTPEASRNLTIQTLLGAAHMLTQTGKAANQLRREVTSPGGTTMAGIEVLSQYRFDEAVIQAVLRAKERSVEMGQQFASQ